MAKKAKAKEKEAEAEEKEEDVAEAEKEEGAEGEGAEGEGGEGQAKPKKSKKKLIIIGVLALIVIAAAVGGGLYFTGMLGGGHEERSEVEIGADGKPIERPVFYTMPEFLVNLNTTGKQTSFLKTTIILELVKQDDVSSIEANLPRLLDAFNTYLRELRSSDLAGSAGIQRLREELLLRANKSLAPVKINDVLFKEIVVQ